MYASRRNLTNVPSPSTRVATAQRKLQLVNDSQVKEFKPDAVSCKVCNTEVKLDGEFEYDLTKWDAHKETCRQVPHFTLFSGVIS